MKIFLNNIILKNTLYLSVFFFPLFVIGFNLGNYPFSLFLVFFSIFTASQITRKKFSGFLLFFWAIMIGWFLITVIFRYPLNQYIFSLLALILVTFSLNTKTDYTIDREKLNNALLLSFLFTSIISFYQLIAYFTNLPTLTDIFPIARETTVAYISGQKFPRVPSTFKEPAHYSIYLLTFYIIIDNYKVIKKHESFYKLSTIFFIFITLSLKGIFLISTYLLIKLFKNIFLRKQVKISFKKLYWILIFAVLIIFVDLNSGNVISKITEKIGTRIYKAGEVIKKKEYNSSEGVRLNVISLFGEYAQREPFYKLLIGEGYAQHDQWIEKNVKHLFKRVKIQNTFVIIYISTGILGLFLFTLYLFSLFFYHKIKFEIWIIFLLLFFSSGYLILYLNWFPILLISIYNKLYTKHAIFNNNN